MFLKQMTVIKRTIVALKESSKCVYAVRNSSLWTQDRVVKSPFKDIKIPDCTLYDYVWQNLEKWPERTVSVCATTCRGYTYEQAFKLSNTFGANLRTKFKIRDGDHVAVMLPNIPDFPLVAMGIIEAGGVITTINPIYTAHEVHRQLLMSDAKVIVAVPEIVDTAKEALKIAKMNIPIISVKINDEATPEGTASFSELTNDVHVDKSCLKEVRRTANDICFLPYSSGTTGLPKGVELSHTNIIAINEMMNEPLITTHNETTATHQDAVMTVLPFFHIYASTVIMFHKMSQGIKLVTLDKFQPEPFFNAMEKYKTNVLFAAPPIILLMASHPAATAKKLQYLERVLNGAAPLADTDAIRFLDKIQRKIDFRQGYGLTETAGPISVTVKGVEDYSSVGYAMANIELKIVDGDLKPLGPNENGELLIRGPMVMKGYKNNPQATTDAFTADGWFRSGDLAVIDGNGIITIQDRLKELIKVNGFQVPPAELEALLRDHPAVNDAAVVGVPHPSKGEAPKAFVVLKKDKKVQSKDICEFVNEKVASYKHIEDVVFLDSIPKSAAGKCLRRVLKEEHC